MKPPSPFHLGLVLCALGLAGGFAFDDAPARPPVVRGGRRVLAADFHVHTSLSDGGLSPFVVARHAARRGLDVVAVTEHNGVLAAQLARFGAGLVGALGRAPAPLVIPGEEITTFRYHLVALGLERTVVPTADVRDVARAVHAQGGVLVAAHPVPRFWAGLTPARSAAEDARLDGAEVAHPFASASDVARWRAADLRAFYDGAEAPLTAIGSSDYHWGSGLGAVRTWVFVDEREPTERGVLDALRAHLTVVKTATGELVGDPALVRAVREEPIPAPPLEDTYAGGSTLDRVLRLLGLLGVLFLVLSRHASAGAGASRRASFTAP